MSPGSVGQHLILTKRDPFIKKEHIEFYHPLFKTFKKGFTTKYVLLMFHESGEGQKTEQNIFVNKRLVPRFGNKIMETLKSFLLSNIIERKN